MNSFFSAVYGSLVIATAEANFAKHEPNFPDAVANIGKCFVARDYPCYADFLKKLRGGHFYSNIF